jgi:hypothetical protein
MYEDAGEARNTAASATSLDSPARPIGIQSSAPAWAARATGVAIGPAVTRPEPPNPRRAVSARSTEQRADPPGVVGFAAQIRAPDHRPGSDPEIVEAQGHERRDPALGHGLVLEAVAERVPEE